MPIPDTLREKIELFRADAMLAQAAAAMPTHQEWIKRRWKAAAQ